MDRLRIQMVGRVDGQGKPYYVSTCNAPIHIDLRETVIHFFPDENPENPDEFWGDLVIRNYDGKHSRGRPNKTRRFKKGQDDSND